MLERIENMPDNVIGVRASAEVSRKDYESVITPAVEEGLKSAPKLRMLVQFGPDFTGFEAGALVADAKVGLRQTDLVGEGRARHGRRLDEACDERVWIPHAGRGEGLQQRRTRPGEGIGRGIV